MKFLYKCKMNVLSVLILPLISSDLTAQVLPPDDSAVNDAPISGYIYFLVPLGLMLGAWILKKRTT